MARRFLWRDKLPNDSLLWLTDWNWSPSILIGLALFCGAYLYGVGPLRNRFKWADRIEPRQIALFLSGAFVIFIALASPLDEIGDEYLFSAHMAQHLLLILVMPPLLLLGTPGWLLRPFLRDAALARIGRFATAPVFALVSFNAIFTLYHVPAIYELALENDTIHIIVHLILMATAVITWLPILSPLPELPRIPPAAQILYLFLQSIPPTILGAIITFADTVLYPTYATAPSIFGMTPLADQQIAGLIMWVPGSGIYLLALTIVFFKWFGHDTEAEPERKTVLE